MLNVSLKILSMTIFGVDRFVLLKINLINFIFIQTKLTFFHEIGTFLEFCLKGYIFRNYFLAEVTFKPGNTYTLSITLGLIVSPDIYSSNNQPLGR